MTAVLGSASKKSGLNVSAGTVKRALGRKGYTPCRAYKKRFVNRETQYARKMYARVHLPTPEEFWQSHMTLTSAPSIPQTAAEHSSHDYPTSDTTPTVWNMLSIKAEHQ